jgi:hypothetical protein
VAGTNRPSLEFHSSRPRSMAMKVRWRSRRSSFNTLLEILVVPGTGLHGVAGWGSWKELPQVLFPGGRNV